MATGLSRRFPGTGNLAVAVLVGVLFLATVGLRLWQPPNTVDDAYITYRYAANLASGHGLVYNPGHPVLGTSSPAYALILAAAAWAFGPGNLPQASLVLNAIVDGLVLALLVLAAYRLGGGSGKGLLAGSIAGLLYAMSGKIVDFSTGGMESPLFTLCLAGTAIFLLTGRGLAASALVGAAVLVRPDGGLLVVALLTALALHDRRLPWREALVAAGPVLAGVSLAWWFYGDPLPASLRAKASGVYFLPDDHALRYLLRHLSGLAVPQFPLGRWLGAEGAGVRAYLSLGASALLPLTLLGLGWAWGRRRGTPAADFLGFYAVFFFAAFAVANPFMMGWYYVPLETAYLVLMALGSLAVAETLSRHLPLMAPAARRGLFAGLLLMALLLPQLQRYQWHTAAGRHAGTLQSEWEKIREWDYLQVARDVKHLTGGTALVAAPEIGAIGFGYPGPVLDTVGLVSPEARAYHPMPRNQVAGNSGIPPDLIAHRQPEVVILLEIFGRKGLLVDPRFNRDYRLWRRYPSRVFGSRGLLVFVRRTAVW